MPELDFFADEAAERVLRLILLGLITLISRATKARIAGACFGICDLVTLSVGTSENSAR